MSRFLANCLALTLLPTASQAYDPRLPVVGKEPRATQKVERYRVARASQAEVLEALGLVQEAGAAPREQVHQTLVAVDPAYAAAYRTFERTGDNVNEWRRFLEKLPKEASYLRAHATYFLGRSLLQRDELEAAAAALEATRGRLRLGLPWSDEATFYLAYIYARLPGRDGAEAANRSRARQLLQALVGAGPQRTASYPEVPERFQEGASWLLRELRGEGMGPLLELAKRMEAIRRLLGRTKTGQPTQKKQEEVVVSLDRLIELMRQKEQGGGGQGGGNGKGPGKGGKAQGNQRSGGPAQNSSLPGGQSRMGELAESSRGPVSEEWGNLRDREREEAVQFLRERFPTRYREIIERYYRALAEEDQ